MNDRAERGFPRSLVLSATLAFFIISFLTLLFYIDYGFKHPAEGRDTPSPAFVPADTPFVLYAPDFPRMWSYMQDSPSCKAFLEKPAPSIQQFAAVVRNNLGVRLTPSRWRVWYGSELLFGSNGKNWFICVRPGLLPRLAEFFLKGPGNANDTDSINIFRVWKNELLFLGSDRAFLEQTASKPRSEITKAEKTSPIIMRTSSGLKGSARFSDDGTVLISCFKGGDDADEPAQSQELHAPLLPKLPGNPPLQIFLPDSSRLGNIVSQLPFAGDGTGPLWTPYSALLQSWRMDALILKDGPIQGPINIGFYGLALEKGFPLPNMGLFAQTTNPILRALQSSGAFPDPVSFVWNSHQGWMLPLLGPEFSLYGVDLDKGSILASTEEIAAKLAGSGIQNIPENSTNGDFIISYDFNTGTPYLEQLSRWAFSHGMVTGMNEADLDSCIKPYFEEMRQIGSVALSGKLDGNRDNFHMALAVKFSISQRERRP